MGLYEFTIKAYGWGYSADDAWEDCQRTFDITIKEIPSYETIASEDEYD